MSTARIVAIGRAILTAEAKDPAVHGALRALQAAVVAVAVAAIRSQLGV